MEFHSFIYVFVFLPIVAFAFHLLKHARLKSFLLTAASVVFYAYNVLWYVVPMFISSILDYFIGEKLKEEDDERRRKRLLLISVVGNLGLLSFFKYTNWITGVWADIAAGIGIASAIGATHIPLPPGISFYTFQTMSYTIDIYKREFRPQGTIWDYFAFVSYFPQLVAGPIERAKDLLPQIAGPATMPPASAWASGIFLILYGLFVKLVFADNFGGIVDFIFQIMNSGQALPPGMGLIFAYAFGFQIYCDFSAYSSIARGTSRLFGIELSRNFLTPYFSKNPSEFWTRWHITLSRWLRDYVYIPLGGNRDGSLLTLRNLMLTMLLGGLWHGAGIFFIIWGFLHGFYLVLYRLFPIDVWLERYAGRFGTVLSIIIFFHLTAFAWIFFRAQPHQFLPIWESIVAFPGAIGTTIALYLDAFPRHASYYNWYLWAVASMKGIIRFDWITFVGAWALFLFTVPLMTLDYFGWRRGAEYADVWDGLKWWWQAAIALGMFYAIVFFGRRETIEFIYFAF